MSKSMSITGFVFSLPLPILLVINMITPVDAPLLAVTFFLMSVISFGLCSTAYKHSQEDKSTKYFALAGIVIDVFLLVVMILYFFIYR